MDGTILAVITESQLIDVLGKGNDWYRLETQAGTQGWMSTSVVILLTLDQVTPPVTPALTAAPQHPIPAPPPPPAPAPAQLEPSPEQVSFLQRLLHATRTQISTAYQAVISTNLTGFLGIILAVVVLGVMVVLALLQRRHTEQLRWSKNELNKLKLRMVITQQRASTPPPLEPEASPTPSTDVPSLAASDLSPVPKSHAAPSVALPVPSWSLPPAEVNLALPFRDSVIEFSTVEQAVLRTLANQGELSEPDLRSALGHQGISQFLPEAVVADMIHKTNGDGRPWLNVRYQNEQFSHAFEQSVLNVENAGSTIMTEEADVEDSDAGPSDGEYIVEVSEVSDRSAGSIKVA